MKEKTAISITEDPLRKLCHTKYVFCLKCDERQSEKRRRVLVDDQRVKAVLVWSLCVPVIMVCVTGCTGSSVVSGCVCRLQPTAPPVGKE